MINKYCIPGLFIFLSLFCFGQRANGNDVDSLKRLLNTTVHDTARVNLLNELSKLYFNDNPDTAIIIASSSRKLAEQINFKTGLALAIKNMGIGYYLKGEYKDAVNSVEKDLSTNPNSTKPKELNKEEVIENQKEEIEEKA